MANGKLIFQQTIHDEKQFKPHQKHPNTKNTDNFQTKSKLLSPQNDLKSTWCPKKANLPLGKFLNYITTRSQKEEKRNNFIKEVTVVAHCESFSKKQLLCPKKGNHDDKMKIQITIGDDKKKCIAHGLNRTRNYTEKKFDTILKNRN